MLALLSSRAFALYADILAADYSHYVRHPGPSELDESILELEGSRVVPVAHHSLVEEMV